MQFLQLYPRIRNFKKSHLIGIDKLKQNVSLWWMSMKSFSDTYTVHLHNRPILLIPMMIL